MTPSSRLEESSAYLTTKRKKENRTNHMSNLQSFPNLSLATVSHMAKPDLSGAKRAQLPDPKQIAVSKHKKQRSVSQTLIKSM